MLRFLGERRFPAVPPLLGWFEYQGRPRTRPSASSRSSSRTGATAGNGPSTGWPGIPTRCSARCAGSGRRSARCTPSWGATRPTRPSRRRNGATSRWRSSSPPSTKGSNASSSTSPTTTSASRRSPTAARSCATSFAASPGSAAPGWRSASTPTFTSARPFSRTAAGRSSTSRASRPAAAGAPGEALAAARRRGPPAPLAYARSPPPAARRRPAGRLGAGAREAFLDGYLDTVDPTLLPATKREVDQLLAIYEMEKAVYELNYELGHRPDWVGIPVAGITRLLEVEVA